MILSAHVDDENGKYLDRMPRSTITHHTFHISSPYPLTGLKHKKERGLWPKNAPQTKKRHTIPCFF
jgi:hypothetical protein